MSCIFFLQTSSSKIPLKGVQLASEEDVCNRNWLSMWSLSIYLDTVSHIHTFTHSHTLTFTHSHAHIHTQIQTHTRTHTTHTLTHTYTPHTHSHTHTHTHTVTMTNTQVVLKGIETNGYVVASSNKVQVFGQEHQPVLKEGDLVTKNSWLAYVGNLQVSLLCNIVTPLRTHSKSRLHNHDVFDCSPHCTFVLRSGH